MEWRKIFLEEILCYGAVMLQPMWLQVEEGEGGYVCLVTRRRDLGRADGRKGCTVTPNVTREEGGRLGEG